MNLTRGNPDAYISAFHTVQREIIETALNRDTGILPIPTGLESHAISLAIQACLARATGKSRGCMGNHVLIFEPLATRRLVAAVASLSMRWRLATDGMLSAGLNLIPLAKVSSYRDAECRFDRWDSRITFWLSQEAGACPS